MAHQVAALEGGEKAIVAANRLSPEPDLRIRFSVLEGDKHRPCFGSDEHGSINNDFQVTFFIGLKHLLGRPTSQAPISRVTN